MAQAAKYVRTSKVREAIRLLFRRSREYKAAMYKVVMKEMVQQMRSYVDSQNSLKKEFSRTSVAAFDVTKLMAEFNTQVPSLVSFMCAALLPREQLQE